MNTETTSDDGPDARAMKRYDQALMRHLASLRECTQAAKEIGASAASATKGDPLTRYQELFGHELHAAMLSEDPPPDISTFYRQWFFKELEKRKGKIADLTWQLLALQLLRQDQ